MHDRISHTPQHADADEAIRQTRRGFLTGTAMALACWLLPPALTAPGGNEIIVVHGWVLKRSDLLP